MSLRYIRWGFAGPFPMRNGFNLTVDQMGTLVDYINRNY